MVQNPEIFHSAEVEEVPQSHWKGLVNGVRSAIEELSWYQRLLPKDASGDIGNVLALEWQAMTGIELGVLGNWLQSPTAVEGLAEKVWDGYAERRDHMAQTLAKRSFQLLPKRQEPLPNSNTYLSGLAVVQLFEAARFRADTKTRTGDKPQPELDGATCEYLTSLMIDDSVIQSIGGRRSPLYAKPSKSMPEQSLVTDLADTFFKIRDEIIGCDEERMASHDLLDGRESGLALAVSMKQARDMAEQTNAQRPDLHERMVAAYDSQSHDPYAGNRGALRVLTDYARLEAPRTIGTALWCTMAY